MLRRLVISLALAALGLPGYARTRPHYGGILRVEIEGDPWVSPDGLARKLVFDGLTTVDADGALHPALATEWEADDNNHRWRFRLRSGVVFHDGSPLTSVAAVAGLNAACASNCPWGAVRAVGSSVVFTSDAPMPNLPALLAGNAFRIPLAIASDGSTPRTGIGTGPFQVASFSNGVLTLTANESCWQGRPFADTIEIRVHRTVRDQWLDLSAGRADLVEVPAEDVRQAKQQRLNVIASAPVELLSLEIATTGALANESLRAAVALAIDREALANVIFQKGGQVAASILPQSLSGYAFLFSANRDVNKARELRGGLSAPTLGIRVDGDGAMELAAQRIALNLREAGFNVQVNSAEGADLVLRRIPIAGSDPAELLDSVLRSVRSAQTIDDTTPAGLYAVERDFLNRHTLIPLLELPRAFASGGRIRDFKLSAGGWPDLANSSLEPGP